MKALLKRIVGGLKFTAAFLPLAATLGGTATFIWLGCEGSARLDNAFEEVKSTPNFQEMVEKDSSILKEQLDNNQITNQDYVNKMETMQSKDFVLSYLNMDKEANKYYLDKIHQADMMETAGFSLTLLYPLAAGVATWLFFAFDGFSNIVYSAKYDFQEAKEIKEEMKKRKEMSKYKEELDEYKEEVE